MAPKKVKDRFKNLTCDESEPRKVEAQGLGKAGNAPPEPLNFHKLNCEGERPIPKKVAAQMADEAPTVADELNARLGMLQVRPESSKPIKPLVKSAPVERLYMYKIVSVCPSKEAEKEKEAAANIRCQHTGNIIIDRDLLTTEEHLCFLATPKKHLTSARQAAAAAQTPRFIKKRITLPACTARVERLADPDVGRVKDILRYFKAILPPRNVQALQSQMKPKPAVEPMSMEKALEYMQEDQRLKRVAKQMHNRRCRSLRKRILQRQRKQMCKIVCVLFEEMKDFLLNDQFIIDEHSPLCAVILERIKDFTDQEFYTTSNLREYQRILANNLTVWINKFISNLNIYLAPQQIPVKRSIYHAEDPEQFVPVSDYISASETHGEEEDFQDQMEYDEDYPYGDEDYLPDVLDAEPKLPSEETLVNPD